VWQLFALEVVREGHYGLSNLKGNTMEKEKLINTKFLNGQGRPAILQITFNVPALSGPVFKELSDILDNIEETQRSKWLHDEGNKIEGIIFTSSNPKIFLAGADLYSLHDILDTSSLLSEVIDIGQETYNRIEKLDVMTVAAVNGMCLGGGLELALACDHIICSNSKGTKLGLPEVTLGILPAWGGTTRLPRRIDMASALKMLLGGSPMAAKPAKKCGLVDIVTHPELLIDVACDVIRGNVKIKNNPFSLKTVIPHFLIQQIAKSNVLKKTKGNYPSPEKIIDIVKVNCSQQDSFQLEKENFLELCKTKEMRNLLRIFFMQEKSKKLYKDVKLPKVRNAAVLGAGTMGAGIAQWLSSRGINTILKDIDAKFVSNGLKTISDLYVAGVHSHVFDRPEARAGLARVYPLTKDTTLKQTEIVIEAIVEKLDVKQKVLSELENQLPDGAIIATNTSALSIDDMASSLKHPERFVGIHFFNPVHKMKLVEVVRGSKTSDDTVERAVKFVQQIGKLPVVVKDSPGFIVNRILMPYLAEAGKLYSEGGDMVTIDKEMVKWGMPMGPFRLMDEIGLDVCKHVADDLSTRLGFESPGVLEEKIRKGNLGKKTGEGFYRYKKGKSIKKKPRKVKLDEKMKYIDRLVSSMVEEAVKVLSERIVESADDIDFAMIMGTGFAPFRGGPLNYSLDDTTSQYALT